ncbi:STAS domain-containing protein [Catellatospora sp. NPDC049609]|uniref:STAS domain-containing protein n=1 Tax=Catellatospora sp. NPDC049609 TaxID=3155505 RepID=UPI00342E2C97
MSTVEMADRLVVRVSGECDMSSSGELAAALTAALESSPRTEVDLGAVGFLDSSGIHVLVTAYRDAQSRGAVVYVTHAAGMVATVLEMTGVGTLLASPSQAER